MVLRKKTTLIVLQFSVLVVSYCGKVSHENEKIILLPGYKIIV